MSDLGAAKPKILELFAQDLSGKNDLQTKIDLYLAKQRLTVRDELNLALLRNRLRFLDPRLPREIPLTPDSLWNYWIDHSEEQQQLWSERDEIMDYLASPEEGSESTNRHKLRMLELIAADNLTFLAYYPVVKDIYRKGRGRPSTRGLVAVRALQLKWDRNELTWKQITKEVCDCSKRDHEEFCRESIRQSVIKLQRLLAKCKR